MVAEGPELGRRPAPVLEHLARQLAKVDGHALGTVEVGVLRLGHEVVDAVAQLVQKRRDLEMAKQAGLAWRWLGKGAEQSRGRIMACSVFSSESLY